MSTEKRRIKSLIDISKERMVQEEIKQSSKIFKSNVQGKFITNFEITRDSILEIVRNKSKIDDVEVECFLDKLSEKTLEVILKDLTSKYSKCRCNND